MRPIKVQELKYHGTPTDFINAPERCREDKIEHNKILNS